MVFILATITEALIISVSVLIACFGVIYLFFFRGKLTSTEASLTKKLSLPIYMSDTDYEFIAERVMQVDGKYQTVLFAATSSNCMPITIPVNAAVCLAQAEKRCLLIDTDTGRNAIAKAFKIEEYTASKFERPQPYKTSFDNLHIWPAQNFSDENIIDLAAVIKEVKNDFDFIIVNAPQLGQTNGQTQIISASNCSFIFSQDAADATKLLLMMKAASCSIIGNINVSAT